MEKEREDYLKHVCNICNRRFSCGKALGGHMRIHGSAYTIKKNKVSFDIQFKKTLANIEKAEQEQEQEMSGGGDLQQRDSIPPKNGNQMYDLRPNRGRSWRYADLDFSYSLPAKRDEFHSSKFEIASTSFNNSQGCGECGEEFSSWKTLIRHMEICPYDEKKEQSDSHEEKQEAEDVYWESESESDKDMAKLPDETNPRRSRTKGNTRSKRPLQSPPTSEDTQVVTPTSEVEFMANCLVMLASSGESWEPTRPSLDRDEECTTSLKRPLADASLLNTKICKIRKRRVPLSIAGSLGDLQKVAVARKKVIKYECKTCKKIFSSFQALGGHRASHNKVKGCSAKQDDKEEEIITSDEDLSSDLGKSTNQLTDLCDDEESTVSGQVLGRQKVAGSGIWGSKEESTWLDLNMPAPDDEPSPTNQLHSHSQSK